MLTVTCKWGFGQKTEKYQFSLSFTATKVFHTVEVYVIFIKCFKYKYKLHKRQSTIFNNKTMPVTAFNPGKHKKRLLHDHNFTSFGIYQSYNRTEGLFLTVLSIMMMTHTCEWKLKYEIFVAFKNQSPF